jgi:hypothetical protein
MQVPINSQEHITCSRVGSILLMTPFPYLRKRAKEDFYWLLLYCFSYDMKPSTMSQEYFLILF